MQSLWSRATQVQRCGCRSCSTVVSRLGQRATVAPRRRASFAEVFTACYSSVFASAALIDSMHKEERRLDIDRRIEEARQDLGSLKEREVLESVEVISPERQLELLTDNQMDGVWQSLKTISTTRPYITDVRDLVQLSPSDPNGKLRGNRYFRRRGRQIPAPMKTKLDLLEKAIMIEEYDESVPGRDAITLEHLHIQSEGVKSLVRRLMHTAQRQAQLSTGWKFGPIFGETSKILKRKWPTYTLRGLAPGAARQETCKLNNALRNILASRRLSKEQKIGRVCYNLLATSHLPDMHTYNTLIVAFDKIGMYSCSRHIIRSFFHDRTLLPTMCTHTAVLHHYQATENHFQFLRTIECLCGVNPTTGALVRRKHIRAVEENRRLLMWSLNSRVCTRVGNFIYEHAPLSKTLVEEVIQGLLAFKLFNEAVHVFIMCLQRMVSLAAGTIKQVLDDCLYSLDWHASSLLWRALSRHEARRLRRLLSCQDVENVAYYVDRLHSLLDLIGINPAVEMLNEEMLSNMDISMDDMAVSLDVLAQTAAELPKGLVESEAGKLSHLETSDKQDSSSWLLQLESLSKEVAKVRMITKVIECGLLRIALGPEAHTFLTSFIGSSAIKESQSLQDEFSRLALPPAWQMRDSATEAVEGEEEEEDQQQQQQQEAENQVTRPQLVDSALEKGLDSDDSAQGPRSAITGNDVNFFYPLQWTRSRDKDNKTLR